MNTEAPSTYDQQAAAFLERFGFKLSIELRTPETCPAWSTDEKRADVRRSSSDCPRCGTVHGREYLITLTGDPGRRGPPLRFPFWGAHADRPDPDARFATCKARGKHPSAYDVLSCIGADASTPDDADEIVREFGPMLPSRAYAIVEHGRKIRAFFTEAECAALSEIQ